MVGGARRQEKASVLVIFAGFAARPGFALSRWAWVLPSELVVSDNRRSGLDAVRVGGRVGLVPCANVTGNESEVLAVRSGPDAALREWPGAEVGYRRHAAAG